MHSLVDEKNYLNKMAIIRYTKDSNIKYAYLNIFPDQFKTEKQKMSDGYVKNTMDYFANRAYAEYIKNRDTFAKNYDLVKGILRREDFYEDDNVKSFTEMIEADLELPSYVKHYSILTTPINELVGELTKRPDTYRVKAFDDESKSEELKFKTELMQQFIMMKAKELIISNNPEATEEEIQKLTLEEIEDDLLDYTSQAEKWANHILTALKAEFNLKELSEEAFRDILISARQFYHIYEDNSNTGFNVEVLNPKLTWFLTTPDMKYTTDVSGRSTGAYASGKVEVMELSEIIEAVPELTKKEIDHLRTSLEDYGLINAREGVIGRDVTPGIDSINYDTYDPLVLQTRMLIESEMKENSDELRDFLGLTSNVSSFGYKYVVITAYWVSKKKIGELTYIDPETGDPVTTLVDENYKSGTIETQISLKWGWVNQIWQGKKIGPDIYHMKPYKLLPYLPIIGTVHEQKNTEARSLVDLMKPFQVIYNVSVNQMFELLRKEIGNVGAVNIRRIPRVKDGDGQDDIDAWEMEARERGIIFDDDSPENTKSPVSNQSVARNIDLTRTAEIQSRYTLAVQMKNECWELIGMSKQRMGNVTASETATGTNTAIQQSYSQTEPLFVAHEYVMGQLYQAMVDAAQYIEAQKPASTISYITSEGTSSFISVSGGEIALRDLKVFLTNRPEDTRMFNEIRQLSQAVIQNGGSLYDVIEMYGTNSVRDLKRSFKKVRDRMMKMQEEAQQMEQQKLQQQEEQFQAAQQQAQQQEMIKMENENHQKELDRLNKKELAIISATGYGQIETADNNNDGIQDILEVQRIQADRDKLNKEHKVKLADIRAKFTLGMEKLKVDKANQANDLAIAKENAKGRNQSSKK
jgi:hypothetical protein